MATPDKLKQQLKDLPPRFRHAVIENSKWDNENPLFSELSKDDEKDYRNWAREHFNPDMPMEIFWHPTTIDECCKIVKEFNKEFENYD